MQRPSDTSASEEEEGRDQGADTEPLALAPTIASGALDETIRPDGYVPWSGAPRDEQAGPSLPRISLARRGQRRRAPAAATGARRISR